MVRSFQIPGSAGRNPAKLLATRFSNRGEQLYEPVLDFILTGEPLSVSMVIRLRWRERKGMGMTTPFIGASLYIPRLFSVIYPSMGFLGPKRRLPAIPEDRNHPSSIASGAAAGLFHFTARITDIFTVELAFEGAPPDA